MNISIDSEDLAPELKSAYINGTLAVVDVDKMNKSLSKAKSFLTEEQIEELKENFQFITQRLY